MSFNALKISDHVYWVGAIDWTLREFHGYTTEQGTTYNAYLIVGEQTILVDAVKAPFLREMMSRIATVCDPRKIDFIVSNHAEMDHSGSLPEVARQVAPQKILTSGPGVQALAEHFSLPVPVEDAADGQELRLGDLTLTFAAARMLHWPESMFTYLNEDGVLFSQDAFGMHLASFERYADEIPSDILWREAAKYFANILLPFSPMITKAVAKVPQTPLGQARIIAPDHGPIWREEIWEIARRYAEWAEQKPTRKAVIVYDTMWESTARMAAAIAEGVRTAGATPRMIHISSSDRSALATELLDAGALLVGSPTLNNQLFPTIADVLSYLKGLRPRNLIGAAFGSYGWSGEGAKLAAEGLREMKVELVADELRVKYVPTDDDLARCHELGETVGAKLGAMVAS